METYERFKALAEKERLTAAEKAEIEEVAQAYGLTLRKNCSSCYRDAAAQIALANKPQTKQKAGEYELCDGIDITIESYKYGKMHVCAKECTKANAERWLAAGVPKNYFKRLPE